MKKTMWLLVAICLFCSSCKQNIINDEMPSAENPYLSEEEFSVISEEEFSVVYEQSSQIEESPEEIFGEDQLSSMEEINLPNALVSSPSPSPSPSPSTSKEDTSIYNSIPSASVPQTQFSSSAPVETDNYVIFSPPSSLAVSEPDGVDFLSDVETEIIRLINEERSSLGLTTLNYDSRLRTASRIRSKELYYNGFIVHERPDGREWETVLQVEVPITVKSAGENLANIEHNMPNYDPAYDAGYWFTTWENSPGHYENIIRASFTHIGVGVYYVKRNNMIYAYATTIFAQL